MYTYHVQTRKISKNSSPRSQRDGPSGKRHRPPASLPGQSTAACLLLLLLGFQTVEPVAVFFYLGRISAQLHVLAESKIDFGDIGRQFECLGEESICLREP